MTKELFFPTPVYYFDVTDSAALNLFLKNRIYSWRDLDQSGIERSNVKKVGSWHSATDMAKRPEYQAFVSVLQQHLDEVYEDQLYANGSQPMCLNMWANINPRNGYNRSHTHPGSLWSGVYYVQAPLESGQIIFKDPRVQASVLVAAFEDKSKHGPEQWSDVFYEAREGRLILFPSWLQHEVEPNLSPLDSPDSDRISISFNFGQALPE
jgi:uncharacterized protein (TIGR02466 family)